MYSYRQRYASSQWLKCCGFTRRKLANQIARLVAIVVKQETDMIGHRRCFLDQFLAFDKITFFFTSHIAFLQRAPFFDATKSMDGFRYLEAPIRGYAAGLSIRVAHIRRLFWIEIHLFHFNECFPEKYISHTIGPTGFLSTRELLTCIYTL